MSKIEILKKCEAYYTFDIGNKPTLKEIQLYISEFPTLQENTKMNEEKPIVKIISSLTLQELLSVSNFIKQDILTFVLRKYKDENFINDYLKVNIAERVKILSFIFNKDKERDLNLEQSLKDIFTKETTSKKDSFIKNLEAADLIIKKEYIKSKVVKDYIFDILSNIKISPLVSVAEIFQSLINYLSEEKQLKLVDKLVKNSEISFIASYTNNQNVIKAILNNEYIENKPKIYSDISKNPNLNEENILLLLELLKNMQNPPTYFNQDNLKNYLLNSNCLDYKNKTSYDLCIESKVHYGNFEHSAPFIDDYSIFFEKQVSFISNKTKALFIDESYYTKEYLLRSSSRAVGDLILIEKIKDRDLIPSKFVNEISLFDSMYHVFDIYFQKNLYQHQILPFMNFHNHNNSELSLKYREFFYEISLDKIYEHKLRNIYLKENDIKYWLDYPHNNESDDILTKRLAYFHQNLTFDIFMKYNLQEFISNEKTDIVEKYLLLKEIQDGGYEKLNENNLFSFFDYFKINESLFEYITKNFDKEYLINLISNKDDSQNKFLLEYHFGKKPSEIDVFDF